MNEEQLQAARMQAIAKVSGANKAFLVCVLMTGLCEIGFAVAIFMELDWNDQTHRLIMLTTGLVYGTLGLAVTALGAYNRLWALRIVQAVQLGPEGLAPEGE
jgi:hypothetical protein